MLRLNLSNGNTGSGLLMNEGTQAALALDNGKGNSHLTAESGHPNNQFNGLNVVSNQNQLSLLGFNQGGDVVKTILNNDGLLGGGSLFALGLGSGSSLQAILLLNLILGLVLGEETENLGSSVLIQSTLELVDGGGDLQALLQDSALALDANIQGPFDITSQVTARLDIIADRVVTGLLCEETGFSALLGSLLGLGDGRGGSNLLGGL